MSLTGASLQRTSRFVIIIGRKPMTKKKQFLSPKQQEVIREAVRASKIKMARLGEKPKVSLPTFNFMEKKDT
jgi:hypothetical protein